MIHKRPVAHGKGHSTSLVIMEEKTKTYTPNGRAARVRTGTAPAGECVQRAGLSGTVLGNVKW